MEGGQGDTPVQKRKQAYGGTEFVQANYSVIHSGKYDGETNSKETTDAICKLMEHVNNINF